MRILHYYRTQDPMVGEHVRLLTEGMSAESEQHVATESTQAQTLLQGGRYDILHLHGCWRNSSRTIASLALRQGARLVLTPHGQLEPWIQDENRWKEKMPKRILYQQHITHSAYAVVVQGQMEQKCLQNLAWNPRLVVIPNAVITHSISREEMSRQTLQLYRKVLDTNPLERMTDEMRSILKTIIQAGITGDRRWLEKEALNEALSNSIQWREIMLYGHQEQITDTIQRGLRVLDLQAPDIALSQAEFFLPQGYQETQLIGAVIGNQFPSENRRLFATIRHINKLVDNRQLSIKHLIELDKELRQYGCKEEQLCERLQEYHLYKLAARIMFLMAERTGLTEGFMPLAPIADRTARRMLRQIDNHLKI